MLSRARWFTVGGGPCGVWRNTINCTWGWVGRGEGRGGEGRGICGEFGLIEGRVRVCDALVFFLGKKLRGVVVCVYMYASCNMRCVVLCV